MVVAEISSEGVARDPAEGEETPDEEVNRRKGLPHQRGRGNRQLSDCCLVYEDDRALGSRSMGSGSGYGERHIVASTRRSTGYTVTSWAARERWQGWGRIENSIEGRK